MNFAGNLSSLIIGLSAFSSIVNYAQSRTVLGSISLIPIIGISVQANKQKTLKQRLEELQRKNRIELAQTKSELEKANTQLLNLKRQYKNACEKRDSLKLELADTQNQALTLSSQLRTSQNNYSQLYANYQALQSRYNELETRLSESENLADNLAQMVAQSQLQIEAYQSELAKANATIEQIQLDTYQIDEYRRLKYEVDTSQAFFEADKKVFEKDIEALNLQLESATSSYDALEAKYNTDIQTAFNQGLEAQLERDKARLRQLEHENQMMSVELNEKKAKALFNSKLGDVAKIIGDDLRPIVASGEPRSGKAQIILSILKEMGIKTGVIPIIYDKSEGGSEKGTWNRANVPSFNNFDMMLDCLRSISHNAKKRPILDDVAAKDLAPIIIVFDESKTALNGVSTKDKDEFSELFAEMKYEMIKHKIILCVISCSYQIQNLKSGKHQLFNGGELENTHLFLNNQNITKFYRDKCEKSEFIDDWLELNKGNYITSYVDTEGSNVALKPLKHPTHHGNKRGEKIANRPVTGINLANIESQAKWLPVDFKNLYKTYTTPNNTRNIERNSTHNNAINAQSRNGTKSLEAIQDNGFVDCESQDIGSNASINGVWQIDEIDCDNIPLELWNLIGESTENQTRTIKTLFNIGASGRNKRYQKARAIYQKVKS